MRCLHSLATLLLALAVSAQDQGQPIAVLSPAKAEPELAADSKVALLGPKFDQANGAAAKDASVASGMDKSHLDSAESGGSGSEFDNDALTQALNMHSHLMGDAFLPANENSVDDDEADGAVRHRHPWCCRAHWWNNRCHACMRRYYWRGRCHRCTYREWQSGRC